MSGNITPDRLLNTLKVLLSPAGGIRSRDEVDRFVSLIQKFSKKLVSKVIYINILQSSSKPLLRAFLAESGWSLLCSWVGTAVTNINLPLCTKLLQLLVVCPAPPTPIKEVVRNQLLYLQQDHLGLASLVHQVFSKWSISDPSVPDLPSVPFATESSSLVLSSPMTPSRRYKKSVVPSLCTVGESTVTPPVHVNFQVSPLVNIEDKVKYRRNFRQNVDPQTWKRRIGKKRPTAPLLGSRDGMNNLISSDSYYTTSSTAKCGTETPSGAAVSARESENDVKMKPLLRVTVAIDNETPSMMNTFTTEELEDDDNYENPLQMFEEISRELKENLLLEKHIAVNKQHARNGSRGRDKNVCSWNAGKDVKIEGSAKDFRLARREKFREEQRILEDENEAIARKERDDRREKMKKEKRESDKKSKERKELEEKKRKLEHEAEERKRREVVEAEFKKKREEERLKRQEKKREESYHASFKKSELKNDLDKEEKLRIKKIAQELKENDSCHNKLKKTGNSNVRDAIVSTASKQLKPMFSIAKNKNKDLLASLSDPGIPQPKRPSSAVREPPSLKKTTPQVKRSQNVDYGVQLKASSSPIKKEANTNDVVNSLNEMGSVKSDEILVEEGIKINESIHEAKSQLENSMQVEAVRVDDAVKEIKSKEKIALSNDKKPYKSNVVGIENFSGNAKNNCIAVDENTEMMSCRKSKHENQDDRVSHKNLKMLIVKKKTNADTEGENKLAPKPRISLKPVSKLKESSSFGSFLEKIEKTTRKRKTGSLEDYKSKRKLSESSKELLKEQDKRKSVPLLPTVARVPRKVSGILVVERGDPPKKRVQWLEGNLVNVEFFEVDADERINVHKLKFEDARQKEREKDRLRLKEEVSKQDTLKEEENEEYLVGLNILTDTGRTNFIPGVRSEEREIQRLREERVLTSVQLGGFSADPSEPDKSRDNSTMLVTRTILYEDVSGEGTKVDYSEEGWPEPKGSRLQFEEGFGAMQFYGEAGKEHLGGQQEQGLCVYNGRLGELGHRVGRGAHYRGFGRGGATLQQMGGFRGGVNRGGGRRDLGLGGKRNIPCKYWRKGSCRDGPNCKFLHL